MSPKAVAIEAPTTKACKCGARSAPLTNSSCLTGNGPAGMQGVGLPATIFIISVLALIVVALSDLNESSALGFGQSYQSQRAFYAAESGAQIALNRIFVGGTACNNSLADINFESGGANPGLNSCSADLSCTQVSVAGTDYYTVTSIGQCGSGFDQAERSIQVRARSD